MIFHRHIVSLSCVLASYAFSSSCYAAGFAVIEHSASGMGNAYAGASAISNDASTAWFNPAGLVLRSKPQLTVAGHLIAPTADYSDRGSSVNPVLTGENVTAGSLTGANEDGGALGVIPNLYYTRPLSDKAYFGLSLNVPFGLATEYGDDWVGRYHAIESSISTLNINPSIGWKLNEQWSVGGGVSAQYVTASLSNAIDSAALCMRLAGTNVDLINACTDDTNGAGLGVANVSTKEKDSKVELEADDWSFGFNVGLMYSPTDKTRVGVAYRSAIKHEAEGDANFSLNQKLAAIINQVNAGLAAAGAGRQLFVDTDASAAVELPQSLSVSLSHQIDSKWQLLGDFTWTGWSSFDELRVKFDSGQNDGVTDESWEDVIRISVGANYQFDERITLRAGLAYDQEAIPDAKHRTPRIPGNDRTWLAFGAGYDLSDTIHLDFGYAHLFVDDTPIDFTDESFYSLRGVYEANVNILSAQLNWNF